MIMIASAVPSMHGKLAEGTMKSFSS